MPTASTTMPAFASVNPAWNAICDYMLLDADGMVLGAEHRLAVSGMLKGDSVSFAVAHFAEYAFAHRDELPPSFLMLGAGCAHVCTMNPGGIDNVGGDRGAALRDALRRDAGETAPRGFPWPQRADDPEPRPGYVEAEPDDVPPALLGAG